jgi:hypothetical protein
MTGSIPPPSPLSYTGQVVVPFVMRTFPPETTFNTFPVPTIWIDTSLDMAYILVSKALGIAIWVTLGGAPGNLDTITTPDSTVVVPTAGNINFLNGTAMTITGLGDSITFNSTGGGIVWVDVTGVTQAMSENTGYVADNGSVVTLTLPSTCSFGSIISVVGKGNGGWIIAQNSGQQIFFGDQMTTLGVSGTLESNHPKDVCKLLCVTTDTEFEVISSIGNITFI